MRSIKLLIVLLLSTHTGWAARVDTVRVFSSAMNKEVPNVVILPDTYASEQNKFPVIYLLHGAFGDFSNWVTQVPEIANMADQYNLIVVCPDGGYTSWYFDSPIDKNMQYETYVAEELTGFIDRSYRTFKRKQGRAISGLSMGGHGALYLAIRHPNTFGAAGSMSGGVDFTPFPEQWDIALRLGPYAENKARWEKNTVFHLVDDLSDPPLKIIFDCGTDDFFIAVNRALHRKLLKQGIPHDYTERPGGHSWAYWSNAVKYQFLFFQEYFLQKE